MATLTTKLRNEYQALFDSCTVGARRQDDVAELARRIKRNKARYTAVADPLGIPWYVVGVIHALEGGLSFTTHLHNGDPLTARTTRVPKGRPADGKPPFAWEESARDALTYEAFGSWHDWSVPGILYKLETYNGWGYRHHPECGYTPYLWSFSNHYTRGKYVGDGVWSATTASEQIGGAVLLRALLGGASLNGHPGPRLLQLANPDMQGPDVVAAQNLLLHNDYGTFDPGKPDGDYGHNTADAVRRAKWELGFPQPQVDQAFGPKLRAFLDGSKPLPADYQARRRSRLADGKSALWGVENTGKIGYSENGPRLAALRTPGSLPLTTDCSGFATLCYAWAGAPNPNSSGAYDPMGTNYTGSMLARCRRVPPGAVKPGDLVVWWPPPTGHHVAVVVEAGKDPLLVSHGSSDGPLKIRFSTETACQARSKACAKNATFLTVF
jgi:lysozyme family protein